MRIHNAIICDQVRKEDNGKPFLLGVYPFDALIPDFPGALELTLWTQLIVDKNGKYDVEFRILKDKKTIKSTKAILDVEDHLMPMTITLALPRIDIEEECTLFFQIREKNKRWKTLKELPVKKRPNSD